MASANWRGSSTSRGLGLPWPTSQNGQRRVQISPMIINVAVPPLKHSPRLGQLASSHTEASLCLRKMRLMRSTSGDRKSTRLNSSHVAISYAVFCLKKKKNHQISVVKQ